MAASINQLSKNDVFKWVYLFSYCLMLTIIGLGNRINWFPYLSYALPFFALTIYLSFKGNWEIIWNVIGNKFISNATIIIAILLITIRIFLRYFAIKYSIWDTGIFSNSICNFISGHGFYSSVLQVPQLSDHFCPNILLLAPIFYFYPNGIILIVVRFLGFIYSIYLTGKLCELLGIHKRAINFFRVIWTMNLGISGVLGYEFQPSSLVIPFIFLMMILYLKKQYLPLIACCMLILGFKEQTSIIIVFLGSYIFFIEKKHMRGIIVGVLGLLAGLFIFFVLTPLLSDVPNIHKSYFDPLANIPEKLNFMWLVLSCTGFMPIIFGIKYLLIILPGMAFNLVTNQINATTLDWHYQDIACTVTFCCSIIAYGQVDSNQKKNLLYKALFSISIFTIFFVNNKFPSYYLEKSIPSKYEISVSESIKKLRKTKYADYALYTQDCIGFYFSDKFKLATFGWRDINQNENHCILLADNLNPWPLNEIHSSVTYYQTKVKEGEYVQLKEFEPLLVFINAVEKK